MMCKDVPHSHDRAPGNRLIFQYIIFGKPFDKLTDLENWHSYRIAIDKAFLFIKKQVLIFMKILVRLSDLFTICGNLL